MVAAAVAKATRRRKVALAALPVAALAVVAKAAQWARLGQAGVVRSG